MANRWKQKQAKKKKKLGIPRSSLGSLSAAQHVFDPEELGAILTELLERLPANKGDARLKQLKEVVTVADGTLFKALPRVAWRSGSTTALAQRRRTSSSRS